MLHTETANQAYMRHIGTNPDGSERVSYKPADIPQTVANGIDELIFDYQLASQEAAKAAKAKSDLAKQLQKLMHSAGVERFDGTSAKALYYKTVREDVDKELLKGCFPEAYAACVSYKSRFHFSVR